MLTTWESLSGVMFIFDALLIEQGDEKLTTINRKMASSVFAAESSILQAVR